MKHFQKELWLTVIFILICVGLSATAQGFATMQNLFDLLNNNAVNIIFAVGLAVVLIAGGIDISFSVAASVIQYVVALLMIQMGDGSNWFWGFLASIAVGFGLGAFNAFLIGYFRIISIVVTIGTFNLFFGVLMYLTKGRSIYWVPDWWTDRITLLRLEAVDGGTAVLHLPVIVMLLVTGFTWYIMSQTGLGRQIYAFGDNENVARRLGVKPLFILLVAYGWMGVCAGLAGLMQVYTVQEVVPNALYGRELFILASVALGGVVLGGGYGSVLGAVLGVAILAVVQNGLNLLGISPFAFNIFTGAIVLISILTSGLLSRKSSHAT